MRVTMLRSGDRFFYNGDLFMAHCVNVGVSSTCVYGSKSNGSLCYLVFSDADTVVPHPGKETPR